MDRVRTFAQPKAGALRTDYHTYTPQFPKTKPNCNMKPILRNPSTLYDVSISKFKKYKTANMYNVVE